jgi:hypothetical protein
MHPQVWPRQYLLEVEKIYLEKIYSSNFVSLVIEGMCDATPDC